MGWTFYTPMFFKNGKVDRKKEMDKQFSQEEKDVTYPDGKVIHYPEYKILKSSMVGSTYYGAVQITNSLKLEQKVVAIVALTCSRDKEFDFGYKDMDETMHPYFYDCPKGILDLLTETTNENALEWRKKCHETRLKKNEALRNKTTLRLLPVGSIIEFASKYNMSDGTKAGDKITLKKIRMDGNVWSDGCYTWRKKFIPENYKVVQLF